MRGQQLFYWHAYRVRRSRPMPFCIPKGCLLPIFWLVVAAIVYINWLPLKFRLCLSLNIYFFACLAQQAQFSDNFCLLCQRRIKRPKDINQLAKSMGDMATGECEVSELREMN